MKPIGSNDLKNYILKCLSIPLRRLNIIVNNELPEGLKVTSHLL